MHTVHSCVQDLMQAWSHWSIQILDIIPFLRVRKPSPDSAGLGRGWGWGWLVSIPPEADSCPCPSSSPIQASGS